MIKPVEARSRIETSVYKNRLPGMPEVLSKRNPVVRYDNKDESDVF